MPRWRASPGGTFPSRKLIILARATLRDAARRPSRQGMPLGCASAMAKGPLRVRSAFFAMSALAGTKGVVKKNCRPSAVRPPCLATWSSAHARAKGLLQQDIGGNAEIRVQSPRHLHAQRPLARKHLGSLGSAANKRNQISRGQSCLFQAETNSAQHGRVAHWHMPSLIKLDQVSEDIQLLTLRRPKFSVDERINAMPVFGGGAGLVCSHHT